MVKGGLEDVAVGARAHGHVGVGQPQHGGGIGAIDVGVDHADLGPLLGQANGNVDRDGAFAHAAFAAGDGQDIFDAINAGAIGQGFLLGRFGGDFHFDPFDAGKGFHGFFAVFDNEFA